MFEKCVWMKGSSKLIILEAVCHVKTNLMSCDFILKNASRYVKIGCAKFFKRIIIMKWFEIKKNQN